MSVNASPSDQPFREPTAAMPPSNAYQDQITNVLSEIERSLDPEKDQKDEFDIP